MGADKVDVVCLEDFASALGKPAHSSVLINISEKCRVARGGRMQVEIPTVSCQSIMRRNSRSSMLSSPTGTPPTLAKIAFTENTSQKVLLAIVMAVITKRWQVKEVKVNSGARAHIWSM